MEFLGEGIALAGLYIGCGVALYKNLNPDDVLFVGFFGSFAVLIGI